MSQSQILIRLKYLILYTKTQDSYRHAGAALGEVDHSRVELVFEEVSMRHHSPSQSQTGGSHQRCSYHFWIQLQILWRKDVKAER